jgi:hypothetical protein
METIDYQTERRLDRREMNKTWVKLILKTGLFSRDIIAPVFPSLIRKYFGEDVVESMCEVYKHDLKLGLKGSFSFIARSDHFVFIVETGIKHHADFRDFHQNLILFRQLFPEYTSIQLIPILSGPYFENFFIQLATREQFYLMSYREWEYMDILNFEEVSKK